MAHVFLITLGLWAFGVGFGVEATPVFAQAAPAASPSDVFFAGTVMESTADKITVGRVVRGQAESRSFRVTPKTRVDGKLATNVRVTVRYATTDDGDVATMIVVRPPVPAPPATNKK